MLEILLNGFDGYLPVKQGNVIFKLDPATISDVSGSGIESSIVKSPNIGSSDVYMIDGEKR